jgi:AFG3 family protein
VQSTISCVILQILHSSMTTRLSTVRQLQMRFYSRQQQLRFRSSHSRLRRDSDATLTSISLDAWKERSDNYQKENHNDLLGFFRRTHVNNQSTVPSPLDDLRALLPSWLAVKIPKGFENFYPRNGKGSASSVEDENAAARESSPDASTATERKTADPQRATFKTKQDKDGKDERWKRNKGGIPPPEENDPQNIPAMIALLLMVMAARRFFSEEGGNTRNGKEITFVDFRNHLLDSGQVEKIVVVNNHLARVILHPGSKGIPTNPSSASSSLVMDRSVEQHHHDGQPDKTVLDFNNPEGGSDASGSQFSLSGTGGSSQTMNSSASSAAAAAHSPVYHFYIGSIESFEDKLSKAQGDIHPRDWVPVQYVNEVNLLVEFIKATPMLALVAILYYYSRGLVGGAGASSGGGMGGMFQVGKSNAKKINPESVKVSFKDVAGCEQAKTEVMEFVQFLSSPEQFTKLGAKIPKGALLTGPPGTGKTLLAKAVAGEAGVPFYSISGSDFIEMFVGVGPSRVRDLFKEARNNSPCIIFIDEIDAVGRQRGRGGFSGGNDERENTLNQLLVEMDGFNPTTGIVVLAGTNRVDILDQALTRPGRFDRQITVDRPDLQGRKEIFNVHLQGLTLEGKKEDYAGRLAGLTPGFAGADIANLCNEAAIVAARRKGDNVTFNDFEKATDRIIGGLESSKIMSKHEKEIVAYHEAGHAVAGWFLEFADPLLKVTIIPRSSGALGFAQYLPRETFLRTQEQIMDIVCKALAGRAAEDVFFGKVTTGASDDLKRVTQLVYSTIQTYGMNSKVGQLAYPQNDDGMPGDKPYSDSTAEAMDDEARAIVHAAYIRTVELIREHKEDVEKVAQLLLEKETITHDDVVDLIGERPFKGDAQYEEFISRRAEINAEAQKDAASTKSEDTDASDATDNQGGLTPGLA